MVHVFHGKVWYSSTMLGLAAFDIAIARVHGLAIFYCPYRYSSTNKMVRTKGTRSTIFKQSTIGIHLNILWRDHVPVVLEYYVYCHTYTCITIIIGTIGNNNNNNKIWIPSGYHLP